MSLRKELNGAYEVVDCIKAIGVKYCEDNDIGTQPVLDFYDDTVSMDTPIINDLHHDLSLFEDVEIINDVNEEVGMAIINNILNLPIRR